MSFRILYNIFSESHRVQYLASGEEGHHFEVNVTSFKF